MVASLSGPLDFQPARVAVSKSRARQIEQETVQVLRQGRPISKAEATRIARLQIERLKKQQCLLSSEYQVLIDRFCDEAVTISVKHRDRRPLFSRDDLIQIGARFQVRGNLSGELYPRESRVVDTANQYWLHSIPVTLEDLDLDQAVHQALAGAVIDHPLWEFQSLPLGGERDWRTVQHHKNQKVGPEREAIDLLHPATAGRGPVLLIPRDPSWRFPLGFDEGIRSEGSIAGSVQRPLGESP